MRAGIFAVLGMLLISGLMAQAKLRETKAKTLVVVGFLTRQDDKAVVVSGRRQFELDWKDFTLQNSFAADHEHRAAKYILPTIHLTAKMLSAEEGVQR